MPALIFWTPALANSVIPTEGFSPSGGALRFLARPRVTRPAVAKVYLPSTSSSLVLFFKNISARYTTTPTAKITCDTRSNVHSPVAR
jgi:hypothetical protein